MCGIAAVHAPPGEGPRWLGGILARIAHRGLASTSHEMVPEQPHGWALGTNRLPIVEPLTGRQPVLSPAGRFLVSMNGEVFNYRELAAELAGQGCPPCAADASDTHVLAAALEHWGVERTLRRLVWEGAFLALERGTGTVWAVRDHLGIKPLYRAEFEAGLAFASEIKALLDLPGCGRVQPVYPGTVERFDRRGDLVGASTWWSPRGRVVRRHTPDHARRELLDLLRAAVHRRVPRDVPYAIALSGGLDSAAVLRLAVETGHVPHAYVLHRPNSQDLRYAQLLCQELDVPLTQVPGMSTDALREHLPEVVSAVETWEWQVVNHAAPMLPLTAAIHADGHRVVLSGEGADELFLGYARADTSLPAKEEQVERIAALHRTNCRRLDRMGMRDQLEFRVPFLDRAVTDWALTLPPDHLVRDGTTKWILREALRDLLPPEIVDRPKLSMARGAGYEYSAAVPTVFGPLSDSSRDDDHPLLGELPRYPAERVFLKHFIRIGYDRADYLLTQSR